MCRLNKRKTSVKTLRPVTDTTTANVHGWRLSGSYPLIPGSGEPAMAAREEQPA